MAAEKVTLTFEVNDSGAVRVLRQAGDEVERTGKKAAVASGSVASVAKRFVAAGVAAYGFIQASRFLVNQYQQMIEVGARFERLMSNVATLISNNTTGAIRQMTSSIQEMMKVLPVSADELGAAAYDIVSAGISKTSDAMDVLRASAALGVAGLATTKEAAGLLTSAINAFQIEGSKANRVAEILFLTVKGGKTTVAELAQQFGALAPIASAAGVSLEEMQAATAALTTGGQPTAEAQTNLRQTIVALLKPTADMVPLLKSIRDRYDEVTEASGQSAIEGLGLVKTMQALSEAAGGNQEVLARALGRVQALSAVLSLSGAQGQRFVEIYRSIREEVGEFDKALVRATDNTATKIQLLSNAFQNVRIGAFTSQAQELNAVLEAAADIVNLFADQISGSSGALVNTFGPALIGGVKIVNGLAQGFLFLADMALAALDGILLAGENIAVGLKSWARAIQVFLGIASDGMEGLLDQSVAADAEVRRNIAMIRSGIQTGAQAANESIIAMEGALDSARMKLEQQGLATERVVRMFEELEASGESTPEALEAIIQKITYLDQMGIKLGDEVTQLAIQYGLIEDSTAATATNVGDMEDGLDASADAAQKLADAMAAVADLYAGRTMLAENTVALEQHVFEQMKEQAARELERARAAGDYQRVQEILRDLQLEGLQVADRLDAAERARLSTAQEIVEKQLALLVGSGKLTEDQRAQADALTTQIELYDLMIAGMSDARDEVGNLIEATNKGLDDAIEKITLDLPDAFRQGLRDSFEAVVAGTRDLSDVWDGLKSSILGSFADAFAGVILGKQSQLDQPLAQNIDSIGGLFGSLADQTALTFGRVFSTIRSGFNSVAKVGKIFGIDIKGYLTDSLGLTGAGTLGGAGGGIYGANGSLFGAGGLFGPGGAIFGNTGSIGATLGGAVSYLTGGTTSGVTAATLASPLVQSGALGASAIAGGTEISTAGLTAAQISAQATSAATAPTGAGALSAGVVGALQGLGFATIIAGFLFIIVQGVLALLAPSTQAVAKRIVDQLVTDVLDARFGDFFRENDIDRGKIVLKGQPQSKRLGSNLDGRRDYSGTSREGIAVATLLTATVDTPFGGFLKEFKFLDQALGQIEDVFDRFPEKAEEFAQALAIAFGGDLGSALSMVQKQTVKIAEAARGLIVPGYVSDDIGRIFGAFDNGGLDRLTDQDRLRLSERYGADILDRVQEAIDAVPDAVQGSFGGSFIGAKFTREALYRTAIQRVILDVFQTQAEALEGIVNEGLLLPMEEMLVTVTDIFTRDAPEAIRASMRRLVRQEYRAAEADTESGMIPVLSNPEAFTRLLELQQEAFSVTKTAIESAASSLASGGVRRDVVEGIREGFRQSVLQRAQTGLSEGFFQTKVFDTVLGPALTRIESALKAAGEADGPAAALEILSGLSGDLANDMEGVRQRIRLLMPVIKEYQALQEQLVLDLTTFDDVVQQLRDGAKALSLLMLQIDGDSEEVRRRVERNAIRDSRRALDRAMDAVGAITGVPVGFGDGDFPLAPIMEALSDDDLKRLPALLDTAASQIVANAELEIGFLQERLALTQEWVDLLPQARDVLAQVKFFGRDEDALNSALFQNSRDRVEGLLDDLRNGNEAERIAAAQQLTSIGPQVLEQALAAGLTVGSEEFETLRNSITFAMEQIVAEGAEREAEALELQRSIEDLQAQALDRLGDIYDVMQAALAEARTRDDIFEDLAENTDVEVPKRIADAAERTFDILNRGINVIAHGKISDLQEKGFEPFSFAGGGIALGREVPALLHGPEVVAPLDKLPQVLRSAGMVADGGAGAPFTMENHITLQGEAPQQSDLDRVRALERDLVAALRSPRVAAAVAHTVKKAANG